LHFYSYPMDKHTSKPTPHRPIPSQQAAQAEEEQRRKAEEAWLEEYNRQLAAATAAAVAAAATASAAAHTSSAHKRGGEWEELADDASSPRAGGMDPGVWGAKRRRMEGGAPVFSRPLPQPWESLEDFVLTSTVGLLVEGGRGVGPSSWQVAAGVLAAGAAATTPAGVDGAARAGARRDAAACQQRYSQLCAAFRAATSALKGGADVAAAPWRRELTHLQSQLQVRRWEGGVG
jgi:hypothetical protein